MAKMDNDSFCCFLIYKCRVSGISSDPVTQFNKFKQHLLFGLQLG